MKVREKAEWYARRLAAMSTREILHRGGEAMRRRTGKHLARRFWKPTPLDASLPVLPGVRERLLAWDVPDVLLAEWREHADDARTGAVLLLGQRWPARPLHERWHLDPVSGRSWPSNQYCHDIEFRHNASLGDVKYVWELGRLQYLQPVAALALKTGDASLAKLCVDHVESWIDHNPFATGIAWASGIELALRIISLLTVSTLVGEHFDPPQRAKFWATLEAHGLWLERFPSLYSSANNHRVAEGLGLLCLGALCPALPRARLWRDEGWAVLCEAGTTQILADGVGAEQSVTYTGVVLEMFLLGVLLARAARLPVPRSYLERLGAAATWLRWLTDQAGNLPRIGDDDNARVIGAYRLDEAHTNSVLSCAAAVFDRPQLTPPGWRPHLRHAVFGFPPRAAPGPSGLRVFADGGYSVARQRVAERDMLAVLDHGELGFLSIAAHGHADALALWLHLDGQPVFADAGTFLYHSGGEWRRHFRGTAAHNTMRVEQADASIPAGHFNWSHKARARLTGAGRNAGSWWLEGEHDGYLGRFGALHRRRVEFSPGAAEIIVIDWLEAPRPLRVEINFLLHPDLRALAEGDDIIVVTQDGQHLLRLKGAGPLLNAIVGPDIPGGWYSPSFNLKQAATRLCWRGVLNPGESQRTALRLIPASQSPLRGERSPHGVPVSAHVEGEPYGEPACSDAVG